MLRYYRVALRRQALPLRHNLPQSPATPGDSSRLGWLCTQSPHHTQGLLLHRSRFYFGTGSPNQEGSPPMAEPLGQPSPPPDPDPVQGMSVKFRCRVWRGRENQHRARRLKLKGAGTVFFHGGSQGTVPWMTCLNKCVCKILGL